MINNKENQNKHTKLAYKHWRVNDYLRLIRKFLGRILSQIFCVLWPPSIHNEIHFLYFMYLKSINWIKLEEKGMRTQKKGSSSGCKWMNSLNALTSPTPKWISIFFSENKKQQQSHEYPHLIPLAHAEQENA